MGISMGQFFILNIMAENYSNMIDLVLAHLTHPWGPPGTLETLGDPWRPCLKMAKMTIFRHVAKKFGQGPPPPLFGQCPKEIDFFMGGVP